MLNFTLASGRRQLLPGFWRYHLVYPLLLLSVLLALVQWFAWDSRSADYLYALEGHSWSLRNHWLLSQVLHEGGKQLSLLLAVLVFFALLGSFGVSALRPWRRIFVYLLCTAIGASVLVNLAKHSLAVSCPWEFSRYGGSLDYLSLPEQLWIRNGAGCFPAGHASAGYAWIGIYFVGLHLHASWRWWGLALPLWCGIIFGVAQQLRGAHFFSHDIATLIFCWMIAVLFYWLLLAPQKSLIDDRVGSAGSVGYE